MVVFITNHQRQKHKSRVTEDNDYNTRIFQSIHIICIVNHWIYKRICIYNQILFSSTEYSVPHDINKVCVCSIHIFENLREIWWNCCPPSRLKRFINTSKFWFHLLRIGFFTPTYVRWKTDAERLTKVWSLHFLRWMINDKC